MIFTMWNSLQYDAHSSLKHNQNSVLKGHKISLSLSHTHTFNMKRQKGTLILIHDGMHVIIITVRLQVSLYS